MNYSNGTSAYQASIIEQCASLNIEIDTDTANKLLFYVKLMHRWNRAYNLTAVKNIVSLINKHIIDSLTILPYLKNSTTMLDVGTGAGLPGIPLAIVNPSLKVHLLDSNGKKICFLRQALVDLNIENVTVHKSRVESFINTTKYDYIVTRAFSSLNIFYEETKHLATRDTLLIAMKGTYPSAEIEEINQIKHTINKIQLPNEIQRHIVTMSANQQHQEQ